MSPILTKCTDQVTIDQVLKGKYKGERNLYQYHKNHNTTKTIEKGDSKMNK